VKELNTANVTEQKIKALLYGKSGTGKTYSALTLKPETTLILSAESGLLPLAGKKFTVWEIEEFDDMAAAYKRLSTAECQAQYKVVFIDSLSEINELCKDKIIKIDRPNMGKDTGKVYTDLLTLPDYQLLQTRMVRMVRAFRDLPYHVIFTALEDSQKNEKTGEITVVPSINGKLATNIAGFFDLVIHMHIKDNGDQVDRFFVTGSMEKAIAKDRSGALELFEQPSWKTVFGKIFKKFGNKEEK
jgi:phage nucleotide-binding protein